jgi:putative peptidoglycan lipid II flippase
MSSSEPTALTAAAAGPRSKPAKSFVAHAKLIGLLTLFSRILGLARETLSAKYFGAGIVSDAFIFAFSIPNLFRKLLGEGALSAAFIPMYTKARKDESLDAGQSSNDFAAASIGVLCVILVAVTVIGELVILALCLAGRHLPGDKILTLKFTAIMLPYVIMICGAAFLSSILQVHRRFGLPAFIPVPLNVIHIVVIILGAKFLHLQIHPRQTSFDPATVATQTKLAYWLSAFVLIAGVLQVSILLPALRQVGFRFRRPPRFWTPAVGRMLKLSLPVALGASVLQVSVLMDKGISLLLAQSVDPKTGQVMKVFHFFGHIVRYPMEVGAVARLNWAQFLYQFPLGVFAIALATAIFPGLSSDALEHDRSAFKAVLRQGIIATMFEGLAASIGLMIVALPATKLLFQHGQMTHHDSILIARSVVFYSSAIWAFSLLQITNRAYYALHDTRTPLVMSVMNILINLAVELPLVWLPGLGESGMAVGTCISFAIQAVIMLAILNRRVGGLELSRCVGPIIKMFVAAVVMGGVCMAIQYSPIYPHAERKIAWSEQLFLLMGVGAGTYLALCGVMGIEVLHHLVPRRSQKDN